MYVQLTCKTKMSYTENCRRSNPFNRDTLMANYQTALTRGIQFACTDLDRRHPKISIQFTGYLCRKRNFIRQQALCNEHSAYQADIATQNAILLIASC